MAEKKHKLLILDDEPSNVEALIRHLEKNKVSYDLESELSGGAELIYYSFLDKESFGTHPYSAVVCDNHFKSSGFEQYDPNFSGIDFLNILLGKKQYMDKSHRKIAKDSFGDLYHDITAHFKDRLILFSGSAYFDSENDPELYGGIKIVQKMPDFESGCCCEKDIVSTLTDMKILHDKDVSPIIEYKKSHHLEAGHAYKKRKLDQHEEMVRQFLEKHGTKEDLDIYTRHKH